MKMPQRYAFGIDAKFKFGEAGDTIRKFLFSYEGGYHNKFKGYNVFWVHGWIRVIGFEIGAGIFIRFDEIEKATPKNGL